MILALATFVPSVANNVTAMGVLEVVSLGVFTLSEVVVFIINGLANGPNASKFGFKNNTAEISDEFFTQV